MRGATALILAAGMSVSACDQPLAPDRDGDASISMKLTEDAAFLRVSDAQLEDARLVVADVIGRVAPALAENGTTSTLVATFTRLDDALRTRDAGSLHRELQKAAQALRVLGDARSTTAAQSEIDVARMVLGAVELLTTPISTDVSAKENQP